MHNATFKRHSEHTQQANDLRLGQLLEVTPAAAYTTDAEGLITNFNRRAKEL
jgi:hypothetical protein